MKKSGRNEKGAFQDSGWNNPFQDAAGGAKTTRYRYSVTLGNQENL